MLHVILDVTHFSSTLFSIYYFIRENIKTLIFQTSTKKRLVRKSASMATHQFKHSFSWLIASPSQCGNTTFVERLIKQWTAVNYDSSVPGAYNGLSGFIKNNKKVKNMKTWAVKQHYDHTA